MHCTVAGWGTCGCPRWLRMCERTRRRMAVFTETQPGGLQSLEKRQDMMQSIFFCLPCKHLLYNARQKRRPRPTQDNKTLLVVHGVVTAPARHGAVPLRAHKELPEDAKAVLHPEKTRPNRVSRGTFPVLSRDPNLFRNHPPPKKKTEATDPFFSHKKRREEGCLQRVERESTPRNPGWFTFPFEPGLKRTRWA